MRRWLLAGTSLALVIGCRAPVVERPAIYEAEPFPALEEDELGVIGGPVGLSEFEFEPELAPDTPPPILDGIPELDPDIEAAVAPYLEARRARLASVNADATRMLVLTRASDTSTTQAYSISSPLGPLEQLTFGDSAVSQASWVPGRARSLVYRSDREGDEDHQIYLRDLGTGVDALLTDGVSRHGPFRLSSATGAPLLAFTGNARAEPDLDVYLSTLDPEPPILALVRDGQWVIVGWTPDGRSLLLRQFWNIERSMIYVAGLDGGMVTPLVSDDELAGVDASFIDARIAASGAIEVLADFGGEHVRVFARDAPVPVVAAEAEPEPEPEAKAGPEPEAKAGPEPEAEARPEPEAEAGPEAEAQEGSGWRPVTPELDADVEAWTRLGDGALAYLINDDGCSRVFVAETSGVTRELPLPRAAVVSGFRSAGSRQLAFNLGSATLPPDAYTLEVDSLSLDRWTVSDTGGETLDFVEPTIERTPSGDGLEIPMVVYRPRGEGPFPVLLWMHGGPEDQARPEFNPMIQYFVGRGVAIVAPNVRGSDGYGRSYRRLDDGILRAGAIADVGAVLDWLEAEPEFDSHRVGIYGVSYGGFMVLASLAAFPDRFVAGGDVVGIANLVTFLENTRGYRQVLRRPEYGDERIPEVREWMDSISPLTHVDQITAPLFVAHGANDPRVPASEAEELVAALRERGNTVWYMLAPTEGHAFKQQINRDTLYVALAMFFERYLLAPPLAEDSPAEIQAW